VTGRTLLALVFTWCAGAAAGGEESAPGGAKGAGPTYLGAVKAVLDANCTGCHAEKHLGELDVSGGLALDSLEAIGRGKVVAPGDPGKSVVIARLRSKDPDSRMPLEAPPLAEEAIVLVERWIAAGAPRGEAGEAPAAAPLPAPRFRPERPIDVRVPLRLAIPPRFTGLAEGAPRKDLELRVKIGPLPPISAVAFSPAAAEGGAARDFLAAGSHGTATVWDLARGEAVKVITAVAGTVHAVRFSPDGRLLALAGGRPGEAGVIALAETGKWEIVKTLSGHREAVLDAAFSPDGLLLASAGYDRTARVWDVRAGTELFTIGEHSDVVRTVAFLDGGKTLASGGADRTVKLTDIASRKVSRTLSGHREAVLAVAARPDGKSVVSAGLEPALRFWNPADGKTVRTSGGHGGRVEEIAASRDGKLLASAGSDRTVRIWSDEGRELKRLEGASEWLHSVDLDPAGRRVAAGAWDGTLRIWDVESRRLLAVLIQPPARDETDLDWAVATPEGCYRASRALVESARIGSPGSAVEIPVAGIASHLDPPGEIEDALAGRKSLPPRFGLEREF
jgi:hypothetical protein